MTTQEVKEKTTPILRKYDVAYAGVFGSVARGESAQKSDVDILLKFKKRALFSTYLNLHKDLAHVLRKDVDLLTEGSVNKFLRPYIEKDLQIIYGQR